jgi:hypothetical protein
MAASRHSLLRCIAACIFILTSTYYAQAASLINIKTVTIIGPQTNSQPATSRDGGVSVILNEKVLWLFDDTTITDASGILVSFSPNTAAIAWDSGNVTGLQYIVHWETEGKASQVVLQDDIRSQTGGWIALTPSEVTFNEKKESGSRLAICESSHLFQGSALY